MSAGSLLVRPAPFVRGRVTTPRLMADVLIGLAPAVAAAVWWFGLSALLVLASATAGAVAVEWMAGRTRRGTLGDGSAALTGVLLGLTLPPGLPLWIAFVGGAVSIGLGKLVWGGLGHNLFNPALVGRAFLQAAFPTALTTWAPPGGPPGFATLAGPHFAIPFLHGKVDAVSAATPLAKMKFAHEPTALGALFSGNVSGSLGETSAGLVLLGGLWLLVRRSFDWRIPLGVLLGVAALSGALHLADPARHATPAFMVASGGLLFGAFFMATDPVTSPLAPRATWAFGIGIGLLVVLIRVFGGLPEGVMYAILLMNAATPLLERAMQPLPFGRGKAGKKK